MPFKFFSEQPIFTCQAHIFTINPATRRSWVQASSKAIDINIFYDSTKPCYRIVSVEDGPAGIKVVINSTITPKMVFKQTSQKFGQWADPKSSGVFGLGFDSELDLTKFVSQFRQCVEATKQLSGESNISGPPKKGESQPSTLKNGLSVAPGGGLMMGDRSTLPLAAPPPPQNSGPLLGPTAAAAASSSSFTTGSSGGRGDDAGSGEQLMHQQYYQDHIQRLERELEAVRRQASKYADPTDPDLPLKSGECLGELKDGLDRVHLGAPSSDSGGTGKDGGSSSVHRPPPIPFLLGGGNDRLDHISGSGDCSNASESATALLKLHDRLGRILQEACDLHKLIGYHLTASANDSNRSPTT